MVLYTLKIADHAFDRGLVRCKTTLRLLQAIKIGYTKRNDHAAAAIRLKVLSTGNPFPLELLASIPCLNSRQWEEYWKKKYAFYSEKAFGGSEWLDMRQQRHEHLVSTTKDFNEAGLSPVELVDMATGGKVEQKYKDILVAYLAREADILLAKHETLSERLIGRSFLAGTEFDTMVTMLKQRPTGEQMVAIGVEAISVEKSQSCFQIELSDGSKIPLNAKSYLSQKLSSRHVAEHASFFLLPPRK